MSIEENSTIKGMIFNKITLAFDGEEEELFLNKYFTDSLVQFRIAFLLVTIMYASFGILDSKLIPAFANAFHIIRYWFVVPLLSLVLLLSFTKLFSKVWQTLLLISFIVAGTGISIMTMLAPDNYFYYEGMMLVFSAGYFFIKLRFFFATIAGWTTLLLFNLGGIFFSHIPTITLITLNFFFISANLIGMFAAYYIEYYIRRDFYQKQQLDRQKAAVDLVNKNLENIVAERTKELIRTNSEKDKFFSIISHDLLSPFNGFLGLTQLMAEELPELTMEEIQEIAATMKRSAVNLFRLLENLLQWARMNQGLIPFNPENVQTVTIAYESISMLMEPALAKEIIIVNNIPVDILVFADKDILQSIFRNLLSNAIKFTPRGGKITLSAIRISNKFVEISISDSGIGMSSTMIENLFRLDVQTNRPGTEEEPSTGLGLMLCKEFIEKHCGKIRVESEEGKGTVFAFTLPATANSLQETQ